MDATAFPFLDTIRDAPNDLAPKLIFADWLEERGFSERATAIRYHVTEWPRFRRGNFKPKTSMVRGLIGAAGERLLQTEAPKYGRGLRFSGSEQLMVCSTIPARRLETHYPSYGSQAQRVRLNIRCGYMERVSMLPHWWLQYGPALVREQPLTVVNLIGYRPFNTGSYFSWHRELNFPYRRSVLHASLFDYLDRVEPAGIGTWSRCRCYSSFADANAALQAAALLWARDAEPSH